MDSCGLRLWFVSPQLSGRVLRKLQVSYTQLTASLELVKHISCHCVCPGVMCVWVAISESSVCSDSDTIL